MGRRDFGLYLLTYSDRMYSNSQSSRRFRGVCALGNIDGVAVVLGLYESALMG